jgi:Protein of unknown function (DUF3891)
MLLREDDRGVLAIGQPSHAWLSGQLARAWGNEQFGSVEPFEEVCLAAEQHDAGWRTRDLKPSYNQQTRLPHSFMEMPLDVHLDLWTEGPRSLVSQSRYAALLVSMHGWRLYARRNLAQAPADEAAAIRTFLEGELAFQRDLIASLRADPAGAAPAAEDLVERNSLLIWTWDYVSLAVCLDWAPVTAKESPTAGEPVDLELTPGSRPGSVRVSPWPFAARELSVRCEGRRLPRAFPDEDEMRRAFTRAPWETLEVRLEP